jgi:hypothetical protein
MQKAHHIGALCFCEPKKLSNYVRQKRHESGAFNRLSKGALIYCRKARAAARKDLAVRVEVTLKRIDIFVIDVSELGYV